MASSALAFFASLRSGLRDRFGLLRELSKSGIVALVLISVLGGYLIGHPFEAPMEVSRLALTLLGILCLASASSALNQYQERHLDAAMPRTAGRPLPSGRITPAQALGFITGALLLGLGILATLDPVLLALGFAAVASYNGLYTLWWKKHWAYAAVPGAVPGALPIAMGAISASRDPYSPVAWYLFALLFFWQMPHFWVLALRFAEDYRKGGFPTLPVAVGAVPTIGQIVLWCLAYCGLALMAPLFTDAGALYLCAAVLVGYKVLSELRGFARDPEQASDPRSRHWLRFFLWINFSLVAYVGALAADLWSVYLIPYLTR
jgi:protoheme IX farnesyltransferase